MTLQLRLKEDSTRQFFTTVAGHTIDKDHWETIIHNDHDIDFLLHRSDIEKRNVEEPEVKEIKVEKPKVEIKKPKKIKKKSSKKKHK